MRGRGRALLVPSALGSCLPDPGPAPESCGAVVAHAAAPCADWQRHCRQNGGKKGLQRNRGAPASAPRRLKPGFVPPRAGSGRGWEDPELQRGTGRSKPPQRGETEQKEEKALARIITKMGDDCPGPCAHEKHPAAAAPWQQCPDPATTCGHLMGDARRCWTPLGLGVAQQTTGDVATSIPGAI